MVPDDDLLAQYRNEIFTATRFVPLDALVTFIPTGQENDQLIQAYSEELGESRWYPVEGGHRVYFPFLEDFQDYDRNRFKLEKGAWNHEHCDACGGTIDDSEPCWATEEEPFLLICDECHQKL